MTKNHIYHFFLELGVYV